MTADKSEVPQVIDSVEGYHRWVQRLEGRSLLYRGLADSTWEVEASAVRRLKQYSKQPSADVPQKAFHDYIRDLLQRARGRGFGIQDGTSLSDLELLAELQHYGAATCLIDFTTNPLAALWFACNKVHPMEDEKDIHGKVVAICTDDPNKFEEITHENKQVEKEVVKFFHNEGKLYIWKPSNRNNRVIAQQSIFILGEMVVESDKYVEVKVKMKDA